jgi:hypothetical protein
MKVRVTLALLAAVLACAVRVHAQDDGVRLLLGRLERAVLAGDGTAYIAALSASANRERAREFAGSEIMPGANRSVVQERDRQALPGSPADAGYRLIVDVFAEFGSRARIATWRLDVKRTGDAGTDGEWTIADQERLSTVENIYRLSLNAAKSFTAHNLKISAEDVDLTLADGSVFVADIDQGTTGLVLLGRGAVSFHPAPATERGQVKIFCGSETSGSIRPTSRRSSTRPRCSRRRSMRASSAAPRKFFARSRRSRS